MTTTTNYYRTAGYSAIDHQLDPLIDVARQWIEDPYTPDATWDQKRETAQSIAETLRVAADHIERLGTPAEPSDVECPKCYTPEGEPCRHMTYYNDLKHPHAERIDLVRGTSKAEWVAW